MMTIAQRLAAEKRKHGHEQEAAHEASRRRQIDAAKHIKSVRKKVMAALKEYDPKSHQSGVYVKVRRRNICITIAYRNRKVRYADDCDEKNVWGLEIGIGFFTNESGIITDEKGFEDSFIEFLKRERLV